MPIIIILLIILVFPGLISSVLLMGASLAISILKVFVVVGAIFAVCLIIGSFFGWLSNPKKQPSEKIRGFLDGLNIFFIIICFLAAINLIVCLLWHLADCDWFCEETIHPAILYSIIIVAVAIIYHLGHIRYTYGPNWKIFKKSKKNASKVSAKDNITAPAQKDTDKLKLSSDAEVDSLTLLCGKNLAIKQASTNAIMKLLFTQYLKRYRLVYWLLEKKMGSRRRRKKFPRKKLKKFVMEHLQK